MYGERIKEIRENAQMTQAQMALVLGTNQQSINRYEKEQIEPNIEMIVRICKKFDVTADYLLGLSEY